MVRARVRVSQSLSVPATLPSTLNPNPAPRPLVQVVRVSQSLSLPSAAAPRPLAVFLRLPSELEPSFTCDRNPFQRPWITLMTSPHPGGSEGAGERGSDREVYLQKSPARPRQAGHFERLCQRGKGDKCCRALRAPPLGLIHTPVTCSSQFDSYRRRRRRRTRRTRRRKRRGRRRDVRAIHEGVPARAQAAIRGVQAGREGTPPNLLKGAIPGRDVGGLIDEQPIRPDMVRVYLAARRMRVSTQVIWCARQPWVIWWAV